MNNYAFERIPDPSEKKEEEGGGDGEDDRPVIE